MTNNDLNHQRPDNTHPSDASPHAHPSYASPHAHPSYASQHTHPQQRRRIHWPLAIGVTLLILLTTIALFPDLFARTSPYTIQQMRFIKTATTFDVEKAPFKPSLEHPMGTDDLGRDILSYIVHGTRTTLTLALLAACVQFALALPAALVARRVGRGLLRAGATFFAAFPGLLLAILVLQIQFFSSLNRLESAIVFIAVMAFVGWMKLAVLLLERIENLREQPFILGAVAIGKSPRQIVFEHLIPHLLPEMVVLFFLEVARNLSLMMQLGLFNVFIGNLRLVLDSNNGNLTFFNISYEPEWSSMLATSRTFLTAAPWTVIFPALAFFVSVLAFNLVAEGLRQTMQRQNATYGTQMRWLLAQVASPKAWAAILVVALLAGAVSFGQARVADARFVMPAPPAAQVEGGDLGNTDPRQQVMETLESLGLALQQQTYQMPARLEVTSARLSINDGIASDNLDVIAPKDFAVIAPGRFTGALVDGTALDLYQLDDWLQTQMTSGSQKLLQPLQSLQSPEPLQSPERKALSALAGKVVLLDGRGYNEDYLSYWSQRIHGYLENLDQPPIAFLWIGGDAAKDTHGIVSATSPLPLIRLSTALGKRLTQETTSGQEMIISGESAARPLPKAGVNLIGTFTPQGKGIIPGEYILIGMAYSNQTLEQQAALRFNLAMVKALTRDANQRRSLLFVFYDGTRSDDTHGVHYFANALPPDVDAQDIKVSLDLSHLGMINPGYEADQSNHLYFSAAQAPLTRQFAWHLGQMLAKGLAAQQPIQALPTERQGIEHRYIDARAMNALYWDAGVANIVISGIPKDWDSLGDILVEMIKRNNY